MPIPFRLRDHALELDGVITAADARSLGVDRATIRRLVVSGELITVGRGVHRMSAHPLTGRTRVRMTTLRVGRRAVLSGAAAAWWWEADDRFPSQITVTMPVGDHRRDVPGTRVRHRRLDAEDQTMHRGLAVTSVPLSVLEAGVEWGSRSSTTRCSESSSRWMASLRRISAAASVKTPRRWVASSKLSDQVLGRRLSAKPSPSSKLTGSTVGWPGTRPSAMTFYYNVQATQASAAFLILPSDSAMPTFSSSSKESLPPKTLSTRNADTVDVLPPGASRRSVTVTPFSAGVIS